jgi:hypothetical protein
MRSPQYEDIDRFRQDEMKPINAQYQQDPRYDYNTGNNQNGLDNNYRSQLLEEMRKNELTNPNSNNYANFIEASRRSPRQYDNLAIEHNQLNICTPFKNNTITQLQQSQQNNSMKNGRYYQEPRAFGSDITTNLFDKFNNRDYKSFRNLNQEYLNYNRVMMDHHMRMREDEARNKKQASVERVRDIDRFEQANLEAKQFKNEQQRLYKMILDNQVKVKEVNCNSSTRLHAPHLNDKVIMPNPCNYVVKFR